MKKQIKSRIVVVLLLLPVCLAQGEDCSARLSSCYSNCDSTTVACGAADACFTFQSQCNKGCSSSYNDCLDRQPKVPTMAPTGEPWDVTQTCPEIEIVQACDGTEYADDINGVAGKMFIPVRDSCDADNKWSPTYGVFDQRSIVYRSKTSIGASDQYLWIYRDKGSYVGSPPTCANYWSDCYLWFMYHGSTCGRSPEFDPEAKYAFFHGNDEVEPWENAGSVINCWNVDDFKETPLEIRCNSDAPFPDEDGGSDAPHEDGASDAPRQVFWTAPFFLMFLIYI
jgi:hypothetical protein